MEFRIICKILDEKLNDKQCKQIFDAFDTDKGGSISYKEFYDLIMETDYILEDDNQILLEYWSKAIVKKLRDLVT